MSTTKKTLSLAQFSMLLALEAIFCFTALGSIPIGPMVATLAILPVVVTAILLGPKAGTAMGFFGGLFSFIVWTFTPPSPLAFVFTPFYSIGEVSGNFWSLVICFVPRILSGTVTAILFKLFSKRFAAKGKSMFLAYGLSGLIGSLVNTFGVLGGIYIFFGRDYAVAFDLAYDLILGIIGMQVLTNGVPEAILAFLVGGAVCMPIHKMLRRSVA